MWGRGGLQPMPQRTLRVDKERKSASGTVLTGDFYETPVSRGWIEKQVWIEHNGNLLFVLLFEPAQCSENSLPPFGIVWALCHSLRHPCARRNVLDACHGLLATIAWLAKTGWLSVTLRTLNGRLTHDSMARTDYAVVSFGV